MNIHRTLMRILLLVVLEIKSTNEIKIIFWLKTTTKTWDISHFTSSLSLFWGASALHNSMKKLLQCLKGWVYSSMRNHTPISHSKPQKGLKFYEFSTNLKKVLQVSMKSLQILMYFYEVVLLPSQNEGISPQIELNHWLLLKKIIHEESLWWIIFNSEGRKFEFTQFWNRLATVWNLEFQNLLPNSV